MAYLPALFSNQWIFSFNVKKCFLRHHLELVPSRKIFLELRFKYTSYKRNRTRFSPSLFAVQLAVVFCNCPFIFQSVIIFVKFKQKLFTPSSRTRAYTEDFPGIDVKIYFLQKEIDFHLFLFVQLASVSFHTTTKYVSFFFFFFFFYGIAWKFRESKFIFHIRWGSFIVHLLKERAKLKWNSSTYLLSLT